MLRQEALDVVFTAHTPAGHHKVCGIGESGYSPPGSCKAAGETVGWSWRVQLKFDFRLGAGNNDFLKFGLVRKHSKLS